MEPDQSWKLMMNQRVPCADTFCSSMKGNPFVFWWIAVTLLWRGHGDFSARDLSTFKEIVVTSALDCSMFRKQQTKVSFTSSLFDIFYQLFNSETYDSLMISFDYLLVRCIVSSVQPAGTFGLPTCGVRSCCRPLVFLWHLGCRPDSWWMSGIQPPKTTLESLAW